MAIPAVQASPVLCSGSGHGGRVQVSRSALSTLAKHRDRWGDHKGEQPSVLQVAMRATLGVPGCGSSRLGQNGEAVTCPGVELCVALVLYRPSRSGRSVPPGPSTEDPKATAVNGRLRGRLICHRKGCEAVQTTWYPPFMPLSRVLIENYRSIQHCEFRPRELTALVGENNAGKSNILRALTTVLGRDWVSAKSFDDHDFRDHDATRDILIELEFSPPLTHVAFKNADPEDVPVIRYTVTHYKVNTKNAKKGDCRLETGCFRQDGEHVMVLKEAPRRGQQRKYAPLTNIPADVRKQIPLIFVGSDRALEDQLPAGRYSMLRRLFEDVHDELITTKVTAYVDGKQQEVSAHELFAQKLLAALDVLRIPAFNTLEELLRSRSLENLGYDPVKDADKLRFRFDLFDAMQFFKSIRLCFNEAGTVIDATNMGTGVQNALVVAIFQAYEQLRKRGAIFLIEEPEMYLHPHRQRFFHETLNRIAESNQVIYTTHSPTFVTIPDFENVGLVYRDANDTTKVRASSLQANDQLREKLRKEFDPERNELFFAKHVVLVEGDTEKLAVPAYATRLEIDLNREGCSVVEVGGKKSMKTFAEIVRSFGLRLTIVFDTDSSQFKTQKDKEEECNADLRSLQTDTVGIIENNPDYEMVLRTEMGESVYLALCEKYPGVSKAIRARLIAADETAPVPPIARRILAGFLP